MILFVLASPEQASGWLMWNIVICVEDKSFGALSFQAKRIKVRSKFMGITQVYHDAWGRKIQPKRRIYGNGE